jgi:RNA-splicing ligase RtcB
MNEFIKQILEHGAMVDQAGSEEERQLIIKDVETLYNKHIEELKLSQNNDLKSISLSEIKKEAKKWAKERSVGVEEQDKECEYDFMCGMLSLRSFLKK